MKNVSVLTFLLTFLTVFTLNTVNAQTYEKIADDTIGYVKAGTFGKPDVAKKTSKMALTQVRVHYKIVTTKAVSTRDNGAKVTVYLDGAMTNDDLQKLTDEFYASLQNKLTKLGISFVDWPAIAGTEYYNDREEATAEKNNVNADGKNGQAWVSFTANKGPVFYRYSVDQTQAFGNELLAYSKMKKIAKMCETLDADFGTFDVVLDFTAIDLSTSKDTVWQEDGRYLSYGADYNIGAMMSVPQSYTLFVTRKNGFDQYASKLPVGQRDFFSGKPFEDKNKAALKTKAIFGDTRFTFTPVVIDAKRELYVAAARRALELYADMFVEKMRLIRNGEKPADKDTAKNDKPLDNTRITDVKAEAKKNNDTTPVTTGELTEAAKQAEKEGKYKLAMDYYAELIKLNPNEFSYYLGHGIMTMNYLKDYKAAVKDFDQAVKLKPDEATLYYNRGAAYLQLQDFKKARKDMDTALSMNPNFTEAYLNRGISLLNLKEYEAALSDFNTGLRLSPRMPNLYRARAIYYKIKGNGQLAQADELRAAQLERGQ